MLDLNPTLLHVDHPQVVLHVFAGLAMAHQDFTEDGVDAKELFHELVPHALPVLLHDVPPPHPDDLPLSEVPEEVFRADLPVVVPVVIPVLEGDEFDGLVIDVSCEPLLGHCEEFLGVEVFGPRRVVLGILGQEFIVVLAFVLLAVVDERHEIVRVAGVTRDQVDKEPCVLWLLEVEFDHAVEVSHGLLQLSRHLLKPFQDVREDTALVSFIRVDLGAKPVNRRSLRLKTPRCIQTHQRGRLGLHLVDLLASDLVDLTLVVVASEPLRLDHVLLRGQVLVERLVLGFLGRLRHKVVLPEDFLRVFELARRDALLLPRLDKLGKLGVP